MIILLARDVDCFIARRIGVISLYHFLFITVSMSAPMPPVPAVPAVLDLQHNLRYIGQILLDVAGELAKFKNLPSLDDIYQLTQQQQQQLTAINDQLNNQQNQLNSIQARYGWIRFFLCRWLPAPHPSSPQHRSYSNAVVQRNCI
jgi:hypothetical protein